MKVRKTGSWVLWYEAVGFLLIIALSWVNEMEGLPEVLFGGKAHVRDWRDTAAQTLVIIYVWAIVFGLTKKLVDHLHHLEGLLKVCAWCRRVGHKGQWLKMEDTAEFKRKELEAGSSSNPDDQRSLAG
jgi:hypothetical protein